MIKFHIITIFPEIFNSYFNESIIKRAQDKQQVQIIIHNLRDYSNDKHKTVDDTPYGGGAGMILKIEPLYKALKQIAPRKKISRRIILLSAKGNSWQQKLAKNYSQKYKEYIFICGRYEGVDERIQNFIDEEISIGNYVLTGGELPAMILVDSITRLLPEVLGNPLSNLDESHSQPGMLEYPQYTKPALFKAGSKKYSIPEILLSGNHAHIKQWRAKNKKQCKI